MGPLPRILIATSFYDNVRPIFFTTVDNLLMGHGSVFHAEKMVEQTSAVDMFRNRAVRIAMQHGFDYVLFADSDMGFPPGVTIGLLAAMETEADERVYITSGVYNVRRQGFVNAIYRWNGASFDDVNADKDKDFTMNSVYAADAVGTGCMLIDLKLFEDKADELTFPWFQYWYEPMQPGGEIMRWSEDLVFGRKCSRIGVHAFVNTSVICRHEIRNSYVHQKDGANYEVVVNGDLHITREEGEDV